MHGLDAIIIAITAGVFLYSLSRRLQLPGILFYLTAGMLLGPLGLGVLQQDLFGGGLPVLVELAVAIILFEGGLSLSSQSFQKAPGGIVRVLAVTMPATGVCGGLLGYYLLDLSPSVATVFGTIIVVTGPTVVGPLLRSVSLPPRLEVMLRWESIWGDVVGVLLSALALKFLAVTQSSTAGVVLLNLLLGIIVGGGLGFTAGYLLSRHLLPWAGSMDDRSLPGILAFAVALGVFLLANKVVDASGPLAAAVAGYSLSRFGSETLHSIRHFKDQLTIIFISTLFILLMSIVDPTGLKLDWLMFTVVALLLGGVIRPLAAYLSLAGTNISTAEKIYVGLMGPRGIVALATASYATLSVSHKGDELEIMFYAIFVIIFLSGAMATLLGRPLARLLGLTVPSSKSGILLVGAHEFGFSLAEELKKYVPVSFLNTDNKLCAVVSWKGHQSMCADALDDDVYEGAKEEGFSRLLAMTTDDAVNHLVCHRAAFHLPASSIYEAQGRRQKVIHLEDSHPIQKAFADDLYMADVLSYFEEHQATIIVVDPSETDLPGIIPLAAVTPDGGVKILTENEYVQARKIICLKIESTG